MTQQLILTSILEIEQIILLCKLSTPISLDPPPPQLLGNRICRFKKGLRQLVFKLHVIFILIVFVLCVDLW
jgi:hypothetical protein